MVPLYFFYDGWALFVMRIAMGAIFIAHGWPKIRNLRKTAESFDGMGFKPGALWGTVAALLEFFGGILFVVGFGVRTVAFLAAIQFLVIIIWKLTKRLPLVSGWEFDLLIFAAALVLMMLGAGAFSLSRGLLWRF